jgi:hypothetical protein
VSYDFFPTIEYYGRLLNKKIVEDLYVEEKNKKNHSF